MFAEPQQEHHWLDPLVGEWTIEIESKMGPDEAPMTSRGRATCRSLGGLWVVIEGEIESPAGNPFTSIMTLGFDPHQNAYTGTFIASMMTYLWLYTDGAMDESGKKLTLNAKGPNFDQGGMANYQDCVEIVDHDHWTLSSQIQGGDGEWTPFMAAHYRRST